MYISKLKLQNFRCYEGTRNLIFSEGLNFLVGDNNCGKTTIFRAIEFLISGKSKEEWISKGTPNGDVTVEVVLSGKELPDLLENSELKKYQPYLMEDEGTFSMILRRSSKETKWKPARGKEKEITIKNISLFNPKTNAYENPTGVDTVITALFDPQFVYSDLNNEEYRDFGKTKIVGKLINEVTEMFRQSESWKKLEESHKEAFGEAGFSKGLHKLEKSIETYMQDQYGNVKVQFDFSLPAIDSFLKTGQILLEDNGIKTNVAEKGTGMQRALAMSLIQVYAQNLKEKKNADKSILFFLDEPETFLHPRAQDRLLNSLENLASHTQVFVTTHSPYLLKSYNRNHSLKVFSREEGKVKIENQNSISLLYERPTWGEINYFAFGVVSEEFHIDLFGRIHEIVSKSFGTDFKSIAGFDKWLTMQEAVPITLTDENHQNIHNGKADKTMTCYIRNCIDHPGNHELEEFHRPKPTRAEIQRSLEEMLQLLKVLSTGTRLKSLKKQFATFSLPKLSVKKCKNWDVCAVINLSTEADVFSSSLDHLLDYSIRGSMEPISHDEDNKNLVALAAFLENSVDPSTYYYLYVDRLSCMVEIPENRYVLVDGKKEPAKGEFCVLEYHEKIYIRRFIPQDNKIYFKATEDESESFICSKEDIRLFGTLTYGKKRTLNMWRPL